MDTGAQSSDPNTVLTTDVVSAFSKLQVRRKTVPRTGFGALRRLRVGSRLRTNHPPTTLSQVSTRTPYLSEPTTPSESPQSLDTGMRDWLTETLSA